MISGQILIDGVDISTVPRSLIRHRISSLSQEAFIFPGTIRQNVDPLGIASDADIIEALQCVDIWKALVSATNSGAHSGVLLDAILTDTTLSEGQKQLFCLARALLKKSNILILDEPTSRYVIFLHLFVSATLTFYNQSGCRDRRQGPESHSPGVPELHYHYGCA